MRIVRVITKVSESQTYAQNFYLSKICLNLFEISDRGLKEETQMSKPPEATRHPIFFFFLNDPSFPKSSLLTTISL